jgi:pSer/pThr/pTyr-binding forkhead associated (FHA) protein
VATAVGEFRGYVLRIDSGEPLELGPFCLLGREPVARDGDPPATIVRFDDVKLSVSKTHIAYGVDERGLWVMDRNSTNGTTVIDPSGRRIACAPGAREYVQIGAQVQIGQRRILVEGPDGAAA